MKEHEFKDGYCRHCGAMEPGENCECLERKVDLNSNPRPIPKSVVDDSEAISARILELKLEKDQMINHVSEE